MTLEPTSLSARILAVVLLMLAVAVTWQVAMMPVVDAFMEQAERLERSRELLVAYRQRQEPIADLQARLDVAKRRQGSAPGYVEAANPVLAGAALQSSVRRILETNGGAARTLQILPAARDGETDAVAVRIDATLPVERLLDFLYDLDRTTPYLFIDSLDLRVPETPPPDQARASARLSMRADISALARIPAK